MTSAIVLGDDPAENRRIWAEYLCRPDWIQAPVPAGMKRGCQAPWDVGVALAITYWPPGIAIMNEYEYPADAEEEIMPTCYGLHSENGEFKAAELLDRIRTAVLMATQAARSAAPHSNPMAEMSRDILAGYIDATDWCLYILASCLMTVWEHARSPTRGAVLPPDEVARLIADILDAAPPSLLAPPDADLPEA